MKTIVRCGCEAVYEQTQAETGYWVEDTADCKVCGHELGAWHGNKVLLFDLVKNPTEQAVSCYACAHCRGPYGQDFGAAATVWIAALRYVLIAQQW